MTTPPSGGTIGGGGFQSGDDFIAARVTIDIPTEGISGLREITQEMDRFRTSVESANRSSETFSSYLMRIAEAANQAATAQENLVQMLERTTDYQNRAVTSGAGGPVPQLNAGPQYVNPFAGAELGMGGGGGAASATPQDVNTQLAALQNNNPRAYINKMAASGQYRMGDIPASSPTGMDIQNAASRISQRTQLTSEGEAGLGTMGEIGSRAGRMGAIAQQVLNEINPGANPLGVPGMIQRGLGAMGQYGAGALGGGLGAGMGRLGALAGPISGAVGLGLAGYGIVQGAGGIYQDYKNMGSVRGGGAAEGFGYEMSIRAMAMNPFISSDQSRQIIQQGLREGYTGKEFDTVAQFVAHNLKEMNMSVSQSFEMTRKNVQEGGMDMAALAATLQELKTLSQNGARSLPELLAGYQQTSSSLISSGMTGPAASTAALTAGQAFSESQVSKGSGEGLVAAMMSSPQGLAMMKYQGGLQVPTGVMPGAMPFLMNTQEEGGAAAQASENVIKQWALRYWNAAGKPKQGTAQWANAVYRWQMWLQSIGVPWANDPPKVKEWFISLTEQGRSPMSEGAGKAQEAITENTQPRDQSMMDRISGTIAGDVNEKFGRGRVLLGMASDFITGKWQGLDKYLERAGEVSDKADIMRAPGQRMPVLSSIQDAYGPNGYEMVDGSGKVVQFSQTNADQMKQFSSGELKWRPKGSTGEGFTARETSGLSSDQVKSMAGGGKTEVSGSVTITLSPEAQKLLQVQGGSRVQLTPHEQQANAGYGQAAPNNAPPGYETRR